MLQAAGFQMPPTKLPSSFHIVSNASWSKLRKADDDPEKVVGVLGIAFKMREVDTYLSTTSLEYFSGDRSAQISAAVRAMRASKLNIPPKSGFAIGKIGDIAQVSSSKYKLRILHEPVDDNRAHVAVRRFPKEDMELFELLANSAWSQVVLNTEVPSGEEAAPAAPAWILPKDPE